MADRYQDRPFPAGDEYDRRGHQGPPKGESDPLAELARLIGQTDPFAGLGRANQPVQPRGKDRGQPQPRPAPDTDDPFAAALGRANQPIPPRGRERGQFYQPPAPAAPEADDPFAALGRANQPVPPRGKERSQFQQPPSQPTSEEDDTFAGLQPRGRERGQGQPQPEPDDPPAGVPSWMQRSAAKEQPAQDFDTEPHPAQRYAAPHPAEPDYGQAPLFLAGAEQHEQADPERYDDALYGQLPERPADLPQDGGYDDPYAYQDEYGAEEDNQAPKPRRGRMITVGVVLALAVVGTGAAFAYRTYVGSPRSGEPPIIRADTGPNKVLPPTQSGDISGKLIQDRLTAGGTERLVSREEQPVDLRDGTSGPRVVFPPLNQNANPPSSASVAPGNRPPGNGSNGTLSGDEPRKIHTLSVKSDQPDSAAPPVAKPAAAPAPRNVAAAARTSPANANASAANVPLALTPQATAVPAGGTSGSMVQVSAQRSEADAMASFKALQGKFPAVLGSREPLIKRADLGDKGIYYRAMVGPFGSPNEAVQFCNGLKTAGGQCVVQRN
jgi:hypothetical protein